MPDAEPPPPRICPTCGKEGRTRFERCPHCRGSYFATPRTVRRRRRLIAGAAGALVAVAIAAFVVVATLDAVVAWALYAFFKPVNRELALLAGWLRLAYSAVFAVAIGQLSGALHVLGNADTMRAFTPDQVHTQALLRIADFHDIWTVSLVL
ncbi:MAG: hypothetical protein JWP53_4180, partial [Conexibacter sp.]|nr:hypothetical protein [Conexibacter sp.]